MTRVPSRGLGTGLRLFPPPTSPRSPQPGGSKTSSCSTCAETTSGAHGESRVPSPWRCVSCANASTKYRTPLARYEMSTARPATGPPLPPASWVPPPRRVVICEAGTRVSACPLTMMLVRSGRQAVNVEGGMSAWMRAGLPVVTRHGRSGRSSRRKRFPRAIPTKSVGLISSTPRLDRRQPPHKRNEAP